MSYESLDRGKYGTSYLDKVLGDMGVQKGRMTNDKGTFRVWTWDAVQDCQGEECPAFNVCYMVKTGKCKVQKQYMRSIFDLIMHNFGKNIDEVTMYKVGMHLIPLYRILFRLKIEELSLLRPTVKGKGGAEMIHPIYKEIRETLKSIELVWKSLGLNHKRPLYGKDIPDDVPPEKFFKGENYYESMESGEVPGLDKKGKRKLNRVKKDEKD